MTPERNILYEEPVETIKGRLEEQINRARWDGEFKGIPAKFRKFNDVPAHLKAKFKEIYGKISDANAFSYQKFDAALGALRKTAIYTHNMGLGKSRVSLLTALAIDKPTLILALPRLVRTVWVKEIGKMGINDWAILERPKQSGIKMLIKTKKNPDKLKGLEGLGKITLKPVPRDKNTTTDPRDPSKIKVMSYNMLLPGAQTFDEIQCKCGTRHNKEVCPGKTIKLTRESETRIDGGKLRSELQQKLNKGKIKPEAAIEAMTKKYGLMAGTHIVSCKIPVKGSDCPVCANKGIFVRLGNAKNPGYHCRRCGYSARTWVPSITRRLKKRVKIMILDESQAVKNISSQRSRHALSLSPEYRFLTSGTPATASVAVDIYHQVKWVLGGKGVMFPYTSIDNFAQTIGRNAENMQKLHSLLDPIQIRRDADDYGVSADVELPPVKERRFVIPMSGNEMRNYNAASENMVKWLAESGKTASDIDLFSRMWTLRRAACTPWVDNPKIKNSTKLEALGIEVRQYREQGKKVLIGTELLDMLNSIEKAIPGAARIDGSVPIKQSDRIIALFQDICPDCNMGLVDEFGRKICPLCEKEHKTPDVLAASRTAVREGVTLNKASVVIFTDPSWTYANAWQFWKRAHRIGAAYDFLDVVYMEAPETIESRMYDIAETRKVAIMEAINRKKVEKAEKINVRNFLSDLLGVTISDPVRRKL